MSYKELIQERNLNDEYLDDYHVLRFYSAFVAVSKGKVVNIKGSFLEFCPLVKMLYGNINFSKDIENVVKDLIEKKISEFGFFTSKRQLDYQDIAVPFGASEMMMYALRQKMIDAAVVVCDGAGSVITSNPEIVQSIGARMNGLFYTTPIKETIKRLESSNCHIVFKDARIKQIEAVKKACELGYKNIAVTVNGFVESELLSEMRFLEKYYPVNITIIVVCTTGVNHKRIDSIGNYADIVWSCASEKIREIIGKKSILQISKKIPVFVLTKRGLNFVSAYSNNPKIFNELNTSNQYLLSRTVTDNPIIMGKDFKYFLSESELPVRSKSEPRFKEQQTN